nr:Chain A, Fiber [Chimpanzee adenovirus Y25]7OP2_B Chain B, Fiber [Chimpanzee adenovirus Y25]7OP2_C Chain C, Fiber [Chimpanzee adenovirus Y25]7OP2_D Chain D, Fiber [Chimpanzee adenovirus Y25]7OP2_E Chain E, Fiber [Chimpanzee adenovirus Y25]7OP2_F Chain F, Fiber [Chimpanzee adenovirus Y25]7OP2_G Chain G, Fiber [Chimpanzee adenovirus Y25]7OP2_H Chain H, Fiber [Chimpanzee adenovirus Y25]7OP2_I Chain I, Fiber [Chimpanzee adenovirus Y25]7OP2_J Chain J, Fiber [Chimpanzee adenovirus Y25]7OP2_K 
KLTLWTTPDPSPNCQLLSDRDAKFTLCLTKCGSQILGTVAVAAVTVGSALNPINDTVKSAIVFLRFDSDGVLMSNSSMVGDYWNFREGQTTQSVAYTNAVGFMPNLGAYPKTQSKTPKNSIVSQVYLNGETTMPMTLTITFNGTDEKDTTPVSTYSMTFTWQWTGDYKDKNITFATNSFTFSYMAQE